MPSTFENVRCCLFVSSILSCISIAEYVVKHLRSSCPTPRTCTCTCEVAALLVDHQNSNLCCLQALKGKTQEAQIKVLEGQTKVLRAENLQVWPVVPLFLFDSSGLKKQKMSCLTIFLAMLLVLPSQTSYLSILKYMILKEFCVLQLVDENQSLEAANAALQSQRIQKSDPKLRRLVGPSLSRKAPALSLEYHGPKGKEAALELNPSADPDPQPAPGPLDSRWASYIHLLGQAEQLHLAAPRDDLFYSPPSSPSSLPSTPASTPPSTPPSTHLGTAKSSIPKVFESLAEATQGAETARDSMREWDKALGVLEAVLSDEERTGAALGGHLAICAVAERLGEAHEALMSSSAEGLRRVSRWVNSRLLSGGREKAQSWAVVLREEIQSVSMELTGAVLGLQKRGEACKKQLSQVMPCL